MNSSFAFRAKLLVLYNVESENKYWYAAYVKAMREKKVARELEALGVEHYLPIQKCRRKWSDRIKIVDRLVIPRIIFIKETPEGRLELLKTLPDRMRFMTENGPYSPVVIPETQMDIFQKMVSGVEAEVTFNGDIPSPGDKVRVKFGPLAGQECEMVRISGKNCIAARLGLLGTATLEIPLSHIEKV